LHAGWNMYLVGTKTPYDSIFGRVIKFLHNQITSWCTRHFIVPAYFFVNFDRN
jgi:hypothetical protein